MEYEKRLARYNDNISIENQEVASENDNYQNVKGIVSGRHKELKQEVNNFLRKSESSDEDFREIRMTTPE